MTLEMIAARNQPAVLLFIYNVTYSISITATPSSLSAPRNGIHVYIILEPIHNI